MRISCNGCRVLRKGCADDCILRPCLQWIKSSESQSNATVFLAKFYGRAGLINLINAGPEHLRPLIFRSLLYEACGRMINPIYGSVGLLWSSNWDHCQAAVDAVLNGMPIMQVPADAATAPHPIMPLEDCDIRHLNLTKDSFSKSNEPHPVHGQTRFKRVGGRRRGRGQLDGAEPARFSVSGWGGNHPEELNRVPSHDSSFFSVETVETSLANRDEKLESKADDDNEVALELSLGLNSVLCPHSATVEDQSVTKVSSADA